MNNVDVCIIGGGISGLHTAYELAKQGVKIKLLEARDRVGGRIYSPSVSAENSAFFDIGPSWFWPGQTNIGNLVIELGLRDSVFQQYAQGDSLYETVVQGVDLTAGSPAKSKVHRGVAGISMSGSCRIKGGLQQITQTLYNKVIALAGQEAIETRAQVASIEASVNNDLLIYYAGARLCQSKQVVLALPPRVALNSIVFEPDLTAERKSELNEVATWMAGHAKCIVVYPEAFWRDSGLSGDIISQVGPLSEIHDATSEDGVSALFGFFATPPNRRKTHKHEIDQLIIAQLVRLFGNKAAMPSEILYKDWARDPLTATKRDQHIPNHHPSNSLSSIAEPGWNKKLIWSGSETAVGHYNGYIEGALTASNAALELLS